MDQAIEPMESSFTCKKSQSCQSTRRDMVQRLTINLVRRYGTWVAAAKPEDVEGDLATAISTPRKGSPTKEMQQQHKETPGPS